MRVIHDRVAAIDVHKDMVKVAVRVPGEKRGKRRTDVLEYAAFYGVLQEMGRELRRRGVTHVVMEASGVYTDPVYYALAELDFEEVMVINPSHAKALKGHKTRGTRSGCWTCTSADCPVSSKIPRPMRLTCEEESSLTTRRGSSARFAGFSGAQVAARDNEGCSTRGPINDSCTFPCCRNVRFTADMA